MWWASGSIVAMRTVSTSSEDRCVQLRWMGGCVHGLYKDRSSDSWTHPCALCSMCQIACWSEPHHLVQHAFTQPNSRLPPHQPRGLHTLSIRTAALIPTHFTLPSLRASLCTAVVFIVLVFLPASPSFRPSLQPAVVLCCVVCLRGVRTSPLSGAAGGRTHRMHRASVRLALSGPPHELPPSRPCQNSDAPTCPSIVRLLCWRGYAACHLSRCARRSYVALSAARPRCPRRSCFPTRLPAGQGRCGCRRMLPPSRPCVHQRLSDSVRDAHLVLPACEPCATCCHATVRLA